MKTHRKGSLSVLNLKYGFIAPLLILMLITASAATPPAKQPPQQDDKVYEIVDILPQFPGGVFTKFLADNINYPIADREKNVSGRVIIKFVVERDGSLSNIVSVISPTEAMLAEVIRVLKMSPKWKAGIKDGKDVRSIYYAPVTFNLKKS